MVGHPIKMMKLWWTIFLILAGFTSCIKDVLPSDDSGVGLMEIPSGFPEMPEPEDNLYSYARWQLGKKLFFDPVLSRDNTIACASCHHPQYAFSDTVALSFGVSQRIGTRNAPTLTNIGYHPYLQREGGVATLEMQVAVPVQEFHEMDFNFVEITERLLQDSQYIAMSLSAYDRLPDPFVVSRALACFQRSLISGNSAFDAYQRGQNPGDFSVGAQRGMAIFFRDDIGCFHCHDGFNFTSYTFENNGLYEEYKDPGRERLTGKLEDRGLFKVPSLRNVGFTAPYMHDGSISTLAEVIEHYNRGGRDYPRKSPHIKKLNLSQQDKADLVLFLESLNDYEFANNSLFRQ
jgi:cytochrome c peroxidase